MKIVYSLSRENEDKVQSFWEGHKIWKKSSSENLTSKFVYSEKATKFCKICTLLLSTVHTDKSKVEICQILWPSQNIWTLLSNIKYKVEDFFKFCALLKKSQLYFGVGQILMSLELANQKRISWGVLYFHWSFVQIAKPLVLF